MKKAVFAVVLLTSLLAAADRRQWRKQDVGTVVTTTATLQIMCTDPDFSWQPVECPKKNVLLLYWAGESSGSWITLAAYPTQTVENLRRVSRWRWFTTREDMVKYVTSHAGDNYFAPEEAYDHGKKLAFKRTEIKTEVPQKPEIHVDVHYEVTE